MPFCQQPDRDEPRIKCGYPVPCPHHTITVDLTKKKPEITIPKRRRLAASALKRVDQIAGRLASKEPKRSRP